VSPAERAAKIVENRPLAWFIASRFARTCPAIPLEDLNSFAIIGLIQAVDRFDPERPKAWSSFAWKVIVRSLIGSIQKEARARRLIGGGSAVECADPGEEFTSSSNAEENKFPDPSCTVANTDTSIDVRALHARLTARLKIREKRIIRMYYGDGRSMHEIAEAEGLTEGRVSQMIAAAIALMRLRHAPDLDAKRRAGLIRQTQYRARQREKKAA
jgi:RNA polymerase sigma factor (sigma-70 family)